MCERSDEPELIRARSRNRRRHRQGPGFLAAAGRWLTAVARCFVALRADKWGPGCTADERRLMPPYRVHASCRRREHHCISRRGRKPNRIYASRSPGRRIGARSPTRSINPVDQSRWHLQVLAAGLQLFI